MADKKTTDEVNGTPAVLSDIIRIARAGLLNFRITLTDILNLFKTDVSIADAIAKKHAEKWVPLTLTTDFATAPASTSTITMNTDQTANVKSGYALKYKIGGVNYYGVATTVAAGLWTIAGAPLSGNITELSYSVYAGQTEMVAIVLPGACLAVALNSLIATTIKTVVKLDKPTGYVVGISTIVDTDDSGATQPNVNVVNGSGNPICSSNAGAGLTIAETWVKSVIDINTANYLIANHDNIELSTDAIGSNGDASDLTCQILIVYP
jgi:hypothetical protein